jgi:hypothetical protein
LDVAAIGTANFLVEWFLSEQTLNGITFLGHSLVLAGFLYLSYDLLGKPQGILKGLLILFTHFVVSILVLAIFAPVMLFVFQQTLRATHLPPHIVDLNQQIGDIIVYTLMIGILQGTLIAFPTHSRTVKRFLWRDALIGFLFAVVFFSIDEYVVFHTPTPINNLNYEIPDFLFYVFMGVAGAGFWRRYGQSPHLTLSDISEEEALQHADRMMQGKDEPHPAFFSLTDFIRALLFWYIVGGLSIILWAVLYIVQGFTQGLLFYVVDLLIGVAPASLVCGSSQYITWKVHRLREKQLGVIGAIISLFGLSFVLIEPLVLFLTKP